MPVVKNNTSLFRILHGFTGLQEYRKFLIDEREAMNVHNEEMFDEFGSNDYITERINSNPSWFGEGTTIDELLRNITQFKRPEIIDNIYRQVSNNLPESVRSKLQEKKLQFNSLGYGMFSMDRFMMSMYKRPAFWSLSKKEYVKPDEVFEKDGKYYLKSDNSDVEKQMKIATHNKKLFAYFPQVNNESKAIEIVITAGANAGVTGDKMLYTGVAGIVLSDLCQKAGIKVRISVFVGSSSNGAITGAIIPIKDFNSPIDQNITALLTSDPRIFRKEMFQGIVANYSSFNISCPSNLGSLPSADDIKMEFEDKKNLTLQKKVFKAEKVFYTSGIFSETAAINTIRDIVENIN